jgi:hypothetical protein
VARINLLLSILGDVLAVWEQGPGIMRIQVEEVETLDPDEIMRR